MPIGRLKTILLTALLATGAPAFAQQAPWDAPRPRGMTEAHERYADSAFEVYQRLGTAFNGNPSEFHRRTWSWQGGRNGVSPLSNMDTADLSRLLNGRYFVFQNARHGDNWSVIYYDAQGAAHMCLGMRGGRHEEQELDYYVNRAVFGLSGVFYWDPEKERTSRPDLAEIKGWPRVGNSRTGQIAAYSWDDGSWNASIGWVQAEYAAGFAEQCPGLPRVSRVNNNQRGTTIQEMARGARAITGFRTAFENDPANPLTVGMFYWAHPPR